LGVKPRIGWQIDPFGHSNTNARLFYEMGFDAMFFGRMDSEEEAERIVNKELEWIQKPIKGTDYGVFFHMMQDTRYCAPEGFAWDLGQNNAPFQNGENLETYNAPERAQQLDDILSGMLAKYDTDQLFVQWGDDFRYMDAFKEYQNLDRMIEFMNTHYSDKYFLRYSTPSDYIDALKGLDHVWPEKTDDMFPYESAFTQYWTGYFTSRANAKAYVKTGSAVQQAANNLFSEVVIDTKASVEAVEAVLSVKDDMMDQMGIYQHHDAITGTAKTHVADDYAMRLHRAITETNTVVAELTDEQLVKLFGVTGNSTWQFCDKTNETYLDCPISSFNLSEGNQVYVSVRSSEEIVEILVPHGHF
jgi:hypothetical protein